MNDEQKAALEAPLDRSNVKQRKQGSAQVSYIEGWWAIAEANRIFGFDGWTRETTDIKCVWEGTLSNKEGNKYYACTYAAQVRVICDGVAREGNGAGHGQSYGNPGDAHESALKEAETDAMKRALMTFGNPFGLALYDKKQENVADVPKHSAEELKSLDNITAAFKAQASVADLEQLAKDAKDEIDALPAGLKEKARAVYSETKKGLENA